MYVQLSPQLRPELTPGWRVLMALRQVDRDLHCNITSIPEPIGDTALRHFVSWYFEPR
jgi:hypothetical protein